MQAMLRLKYSFILLSVAFFRFDARQIPTRCDESIADNPSIRLDLSAHHCIHEKKIISTLYGLHIWNLSAARPNVVPQQKLSIKEARPNGSIWGKHLIAA